MGERGSGARWEEPTLSVKVGARPICDARLQRRVGDEVQLLLLEHGAGETPDAVHDVLHRLIGLLGGEDRASPIDLLVIDALRDRADRASTTVRH